MRSALATMTGMESVLFFPSRRGQPGRRAGLSRLASRLAAAGLLLAGGTALATPPSIPSTDCTEDAAAPHCAPDSPVPFASFDAPAPVADEPSVQEGEDPEALSLTRAGGTGFLGAAQPRPADGALLQTRLALPWASGHLDAVLSPAPGGGTRLEPRGMGLKMRLPEQGGELMLGRYVSGGGGLRPDLPLVGLRYSSRVNGLPALGSLAPTSSAALGGSLVLPGGEGQPLGRLDFRLRELRGSAPVAVAGGGLRLLPRGESDVSFEAGMLAQDARDFESTGIPTASFTLRHGLRERQTLSARAVSAGDSLLLAGLSEFRMMGVATAGATLRDRGRGAEPGWLLAHEYQVQGLASRLRFEGLGGSPSPDGSGLLGTPSRQKTEFSLSWATSPRSSFTLMASDRIGLDGERADLLGLTTSVKSRDGQQLSLGLRHANEGEAWTQFTIDWRIPLGRRSTPQRSVQSLAGGFGQGGALH